jgi:hypothetical protein
MKFLAKLLILVAITNGHVYLNSPLSRGTDLYGNQLNLINQQQSGGYVDQYYYHGNQ